MKKLNLFSIFFIVFGVYLFTIHPTISPYRDSGDLVVASATLGIAHPPGYPLYVIAGKIFTIIIPLGNVAYRVNVMSAFFGALGIFVLGICIRYFFNNPSRNSNDTSRLRYASPHRRISSFPKTSYYTSDKTPWGFNKFVVVSLSLFWLAFSPAFWRLSQVSEMYSLNACIAALIVLFVLKFISTGSSNNLSNKYALLCLIIFICGLAAGNHQTVVFLFPGIAWLILRAEKFSVAQYFSVLIFFLAGLSIYIFLPVRSFTDPVSDWGNPENIHNIWRMVTRADYGGMRLHPEQSTFSWTAAGVTGHVWVYIKSLVSQFTIFGFLLGSVGIIFGRKDRSFQFLMISLIVSGPLFIIFSNLPPAEKTTLPILEPHLVMPNMLFAFFIAEGAQKLVKLPVAGMLLLFGFVIHSYVQHLPLCNYRFHFYAYDYGRNLLATAEKGSLIYNPDDPTAFITSYFQSVCGKREDVRLIAYFRTRWGYDLLKKKHPEILPSREISSGMELSTTILDFNRRRFPIYAELPGKFPGGYFSYPNGLLYRLSGKGEDDPSGLKYNYYSSLNRNRQSSKYDFFTNQVISYYAAARNNLGMSFAKNGNYDLAEREYYYALGIDPNLDASYNNLGTLEYYRKNYGESAKWFKKVINEDPDNEYAMYNLGLVYKSTGEIETAEKLFKKAWETKYHPDAGNELGLIAMNSGDTDFAIRIFRSILSRYPKYLTAFYNLGIVYQRVGDYTESRRSLKIYLAGFPEGKERDEIIKILENIPEN